MCWTNKKLDRQLAGKDIIVYKVVFFENNSCVSPYQEFNYDFHKIYTEVIHVDYRYGLYCINKGFHSYKSLKSAQFILTRFISRNICNGRIVKCTIPKGAIYYINDDKEVVSNQIIIDSYE